MISPMRNIAILGSTGSIGTQALEVVQQNPDAFNVQVLTANTNVESLVSQARTFQPDYAVICDQSCYETLKNGVSDLAVTPLAGIDAIDDVVTKSTVDLVLTGMVGFSGLRPTLSAIKAGKTIALANKETLVVAGKLVTDLAYQYNVPLIPVDSEHSAIFQCLNGEYHKTVSKVHLTASGGPFRGLKADKLEAVTKDQALKHPNWDMGAKITIDSASMMNKGLEVIEAKWLFGLSRQEIDVIIHPQSIVHSLVEFNDGTLKAEMGLADMRLPIQYALGYPERLPNSFPRFSFSDFKELTFEKPDYETFRNLTLAFEALDADGNAPCILNAANEIAVEAFLKDRIHFLDIPRVNEQCMEQMPYKSEPSLSELQETDQATRSYAHSLLQHQNTVNS
jgi:1-deoxy-D-xylulose-5-phosphate reductoisomerase